MTTQHIPPEWAFEFHAHECPFMPLGYRMGKLALAFLGADKEADHGFFIFPELGEGHPQNCMMDGMQIAGLVSGLVIPRQLFAEMSVKGANNSLPFSMWLTSPKNLIGCVSFHLKRTHIVLHHLKQNTL